MRSQLHALWLETSRFQLPQRRGVPAFFTPCYSVPDHADPWRSAKGAGWMVGSRDGDRRKRHIGEDGIPDVRNHPAPVISSGGIMLHENTVKTATASRSREIFLVVGNTEFFKTPQLLRRSRLFEADPSPGLWPPPFSLKGRRFNGQANRLIYAKLECPLCGHPA